VRGPRATSVHSLETGDSDEEDSAYGEDSVAPSGSCSYRADASCSGFASLSPYRGADSLTDSSDTESEWGEDEWPLEHPLPLPLYGCARPGLSFPTVRHYEVFTDLLADILRDALKALPYDSVSSFFQFAQEFLAERHLYSSLREFFRSYDLPVLQGRNTCVGLAGDLLSRLSGLEDRYPGVKDCLYMVSCEEIIEDVATYCSGSSPPLGSCEKEHIMICGRVTVSGRGGVVLMDPGYHVAVPITIMEDSAYPHSPPYKAGATKVFSYRFHEANPLFVEWEVDKGDGKVHTNVVFIDKPFLTGLDHAERRNLVWPVKILANRSRDGVLTSGFYFSMKKLEDCEVTFFLNDASGQNTKVKIPISYFRSNPSVWYESRTCSLAQPLILRGEREGVSGDRNPDWDSIVRTVETEANRPNEISRLLDNVIDFLQTDGFLREFYEIHEEIIEFSDIN